MQYNKKSVEDIDVSGKKVIVRCDFNVPQDENGNITDDKRIRAEQQQPHGYGSQDHPQQQAALPGPARGPLQTLQGKAPAFVVGVQLHGGGIRRVKQPAPGGGHVQGI